MKYELANSSDDENEPAFPFRLSYLQHYYYPLSAILIGKNTMADKLNYLNSTACSKLKKQLRKDYPYINLSDDDSERMFFDNNLRYIADMGSMEDKAQNALQAKGSSNTRAQRNIKREKHGPKTKKSTGPETKKIILHSLFNSHKSLNLDEPCPYLGTIPNKNLLAKNRTNWYADFCQSLIFAKKDASELASFALKHLRTTTYVIEDRMIRALEDENAYLFFRVFAETLVVFEDLYYRKKDFYSALRIDGDLIIKNHRSEEARIYRVESASNATPDDVAIVVYSGTVFQCGGRSVRLHDGIDVAKNAFLVFNREGISVNFRENIDDTQGTGYDNIRSILNTSLDKGDYVINNKRIYKVGTLGEKHSYEGICFDDLFKDRWEGLAEE